MRYTVKELQNLVSTFNESEIIHLWYRHKEDFEDEDETVDESTWSKLADYRGRIEDCIDEVMQDLIDDPTQRYDFDVKK